MPNFPRVIHLFRIPLCVALVAAVSFSALGQAEDVKLTGKPYIDMNYGSYLSASIEVGPGNIAYKLLGELGGATTVGPLLVGLDKPVNALSVGSDVADIVNIASLTVTQAMADKKK